MNTDDIQGDFATGGKTYLNNASVSPMPLAAIRSMADFFASYCEMGPDSANSEAFVEQRMQKTRRIISEIIGCSPEEIVLTQSTTDGVNAVARGLSFSPDANIVIRGMGHEHHANYYPWLRLARRIKVNNLRVDEDGLFDIPQLVKLLDDKTHLVALSHALYNTGAILPVEEIGEILEKRNIPYFLDAAQTVGCIGELDVSKMRCNFMAFNGSKWLCGPMGTGLFYCRKDSADMLEPLAVGGESATLDGGTELAYKGIPAKFEAGFRNYAGMAGLEASASYLLRYGMNNIRKKLVKLAGQFRGEMEKIPGATLYGPSSERCRTGIVSFNLKGMDPEYVVERLERQKTVLAVREILDKKLVRLSPHFFNTEEQIQKTAELVRAL